MEKIIKFRLFTWFEEVDSPVLPGTTVLAERIAHFGEKVDITNPAYVKRGEDLGAFYTKDEAKAIEDGTYSGHDAALLTQFRAGQRPESLIQPIDGEGSVSIDDMSSEQLAEYISENKLNVQDTLALLPEDANEDQINKLLDAETIHTESDPRAGVERTLDARLQALNS